MRGFLIVVGALLALVVVSAGAYAIQWVTAPARGALDAREKIQADGNYRIVAYNHFFDLCAAVQTDEQNLAAAYQELKTAPKSDRVRLQVNITGISADRARSVNEYNADAAKDYTIGQFKSSKLPYQLPTTYSRGESTVCTVS